jgi:hypothetical protein
LAQRLFDAPVGLGRANRGKFDRQRQIGLHIEAPVFAPGRVCLPPRLPGDLKRPKTPVGGIDEARAGRSFFRPAASNDETQVPRWSRPTPFPTV